MTETARSVTNQVTAAMLRRLASVVRRRATLAVPHTFVKLQAGPVPEPSEVLVPLRRLAVAVRASRCSQPGAQVRVRIRVLRAVASSTESLA